MVNCCVVGCNNNRQNSLETLHQFPSKEKERERYEAWKRIVNPKNFNPNSNNVVCSAHFKESDFENNLMRALLPNERIKKLLKNTAVPSLLLDKDNAKVKLSNQPTTDPDQLATPSSTNDKNMVQIKNLMLRNMRPAHEALSEDWTSVQGQFGWIELCDTMMPYLTRGGEKYVSLRMVNTKILIKYNQLFTEEVYNCFRVETLKVTKAETALLNEINFRHCDNSFGKLEFTINDQIIKPDIVKQMDGFLEFCTAKLLEKKPGKRKECGFIRIASQNCVPYVWYDDTQYVPLFYFEGECKYLEEKARELRGWELAYLKLACKVQGIRKALFDNESVLVVEMSLVKKFFPTNTLFESIWLTGPNTDFLVNKHPNKMTTRASKAKYQPTIQQTGMNATTKESNPQQPYATTLASTSTNTGVVSSIMAYNSYNHPLSVPITTTMDTSGSGPGGVSNMSYNSYKQTLSLKAVSKPNNSRSNMLQIPDFACNSTTDYPYFLLRRACDDRQIDCFNLMPYTTTDLLVALEEVATCLGVAIDLLVNAVNMVRVDIYLPNKLQIRYLERNSKYPTVGLLKFDDFIDNVAQIRYVLSSFKF